MTKFDMQDVVDILRNGGIVVFPTDTVWGVGAAINSPEGINKLYQIKRRDPQKPTGIFVGDLQMAREYGQLNSTATELVQKYWPGQLSVVVRATDKVPNSIQGPEGTVSLRMPNHPTTAHLLLLLGVPLVQTSANFADQPTPSSFEEIDPSFLKIVDHVIEGGCANELPSTIVDATTEPVRVLRQGPIHIQ